MNTKTSKHWNGKIDTLQADYLQDVMTQMGTYGDRVQFGLGGKGQRPIFQVINNSDKKMAFDSNNHLMHPEAGEFEGSNATVIFSMEQIQVAKATNGTKTSSASRAPRSTSGAKAGTRTASGSVRGSTAATRAKELLDTEKYNYYKANRQTLPPEIGEHSDEIADLMKKGMSAEEAFTDVIKRHF